MTQNNRFPPGWDEARVNRVLERYEAQSDEEVAAEDEAALESTTKRRKRPGRVWRSRGPDGRK